MKTAIHLLVPMSGQGTRYLKAGYTQPKPMIPVSGTPMVSRLLSCFPERWPSHFVIAANHAGTGLEELLRSERPNANITLIPPHSLGPSQAILEGLKAIPADAPVFVSYCDYGMVWDSSLFERFVETTNCDACVVSYSGFHAHYASPVKYAYSRMEGERVVEVREKGSFTDDREKEFASAGGYYFKSAKILKESIEAQIKLGLSLNGEYYTSLTVEALLRSRPSSQVRVFEIPGFFQWGTPEDLKTFEYWEKTFNRYLRNAATNTEVDQVLMPMAGLGSRFSEITSVPKPLIPVNGLPMFRAALDSLPKAPKTVLVGLEAISPRLKAQLPKNGSLVSLKETPPGQALSTEAGLSDLDPNGDVVVSSCDHGIVLDPYAWKQFRSSPDCDAAIFTVTGFPGVTARPQAFAYVVPKIDSGRFPLVEKVSVKKSVSDQPSLDSLLVGTFWFKSPSVLKSGIEELKKQNLRVNGELYLDSIFDLLSKMGFKVRMIPLEGYIGWGDPDSLSQALYWQEIFCGYRIEPRIRFPGVK